MNRSDAMIARYRRLWLLLPVLGLGIHLRAQASAGAPNGFNFGALYLQGYNDNVLYSLTQPEADETSQLQLTLDGQWAGPHWSLAVAYNPDGEAYWHNPKLDFLAQNYTQALSLGLGPHTQLNWTLAAFRFPEIAGSLGASGDLLSATNPSELTAPDLILTGGTSAVSLTQQYSRSSSWSVDFTATDVGFTADTAVLQGAPPPATFNQYSVGGGLSWSHQLTADTSFSLSAGDTQLWLPGQRDAYLNAQVSLQQRLGRYVTLQAGGGPAWNQSASTAAPGSQPGADTYAANASLTYTRHGALYGVRWQRADEVGYAPGALTTDMAVLQLGYGWRAWSAEASGGFTANTLPPYGTGTPSLKQRGVFLGFQFSYQIMPAWSLFASESFNSINDPLLADVSGPVGRLRDVQFACGISFRLGGAGQPGL